ncbi:sugar ABC transporter ATP-binding protein [Nordella sp. HKS 07]|uniref:sugar ABC transporter ATP-binding protein n=1 Tax=Nordella sp. HKS 07 TaxID=2712222 RepID=UPI0013E154C1|nr:sugar ABC transporter ATP-binding protein [Nordella sp. HKS 07]QIG50169.1 sugar ABC transporter ATP-binding protein [Nordella sp. HKS 07]
MTEKLSVRGVSKSFDGTHALRDVSFSAKRGEVLAVCGENGAGKSTLMKILSGAILPDSGRIALDGAEVEITSPSQAMTLGIRTVYQELSLLPHLSVAENLLLGRMPHRGPSWRIDWPATKTLARQALSALGFKNIDVDARTSDLSVSLQQMVEIAKALIDEPGILILDEPTAVLSAREAELLFEKIRHLTSLGTTVLYISHRIEEIFEISDHTLVLKDGAAVLSAETRSITRDELIRALVGRSLEAIYPQRDTRLGNTVLECEGLSREGIFTDVSFQIRAGEIVGMFGLVGSGRTDVAKAIFGASPATAGEIRIDGHKAAITDPRSAIGRGIVMVTEDRKTDGLALELSAIENGGLASMEAISRHGVLNIPLQSKRVGAKLDQLAIRPRAPHRPARQFSGGNQQKIVLAKWLLVDKVRLFIFDEPTRGVDIATKVEIYRMIADLADQGLAILLISSEMPEILGMSDRVVIMRNGRIAGELERKDFSMEMVFSFAAGVEHSRLSA